ncbi:MAG: OmpH family outer membrane protein [Alistipes sp.]|nr:OmpH family outer membrane protein [Alistipes sp.]MBQ6870287.1 OmpH family outer membrane protein [Alistipes sp.]MBQ9962209.1 OmpH family outer membrane protein [Alistipes sp.]
MKRIIIALAAIVIGLGAASAQKYIVVDSEKIFRSIAQYNSAISTLDAMARDYQSKVDAAYAKVESMYNTYVSQKQSMTEAARVAQEQAILAEERKVAEYQESIFGNDGLMMKKRIELIQPVQQKVFKAIDDYAKSGGYDMVLDTAANAAMLYHSEAVDHTNKIIELLK